jgi:methyl-accepting chemotaxis protein
MQWFSNLNAAPRLMLSFGLLMAITMGICFLGIYDLSEANQRMSVLYQEDMTGAIHADNLVIARYSLGRSGRDAIINMQDPQIVATDEKATASDFEKIHSNLDAAGKIFYSTEGREIIASLRNALPAYERAWHDLYQNIHARDLAASKSALTIANDVGKSFADTADKAKAVKESRAEEKFQLNTQTYQTARMIMLAATLMVLVLGVVLAIMIARSFSVPLGFAVSTLERVAGGDLTAQLDLHTRDELGRMALALNDALGKVRSTMQEVSMNASSVSASSQELAAAADAIASGAQQQAASLEETSASLEQITAAVRQSADNAKQASQLASGSRDSAEAGQVVVTHAITAMAEINVASAKISDIISTIDEIAFQTNLLAVNAAVEAARAGEEGRGFAVVAAEVRSLAQRSAGAAKEIKTLIQDSLRKVDKGSELVNKSGETLRSIVGSVKGVTDVVGEIAAAAGEQSTGVEQVNTAMTQMDQVTQSNAAQTEELSSTAQALSEQSLRLTELVGTFVLGKNGNSSYGATPARRSASGARPQSAAKPRGATPTAVTATGKANAVRVRPSANPQTAVAVAAKDDDASFEEF